MVRPLAIALCVLLGACASSAPRVEPEPEPPAAPTVYRHPASGMEFPLEVETLARGDVTVYDESGKDVSVGYERFDDDLGVIVTVYIYPRRRSLRDELESAKEELVAVREGAVFIADGTLELEQHGEVQTGGRAHYMVRDPQTGVPCISHIYLFTYGSWHLKYRVTFPAVQHELADAVVMRFMHALVWPEVATGPIARASGQVRRK